MVKKKKIFVKAGGSVEKASSGRGRTVTSSTGESFRLQPGQNLVTTKTSKGRTFSAIDQGGDSSPSVKPEGRINLTKKTSGTFEERGQPQTIGQPKQKVSFGQALKGIAEKTTLLPGVSAQVPLGIKLTAGAIGATLGGILGLGAGATGSKAIITTGSQLGFKAPSLATTRSFIGKPATTGIDKIFHAVRPVATRFASNTKSSGLTTSLLKRVGLSSTGAGILLATIGTYPFAGFIKEEALQTLNFPIARAVQAGDFEGASNLINEVDEIVNAQNDIIDKIPYVNVIKNLKLFMKSTEEANNEWKRLLNIERGVVTGEVLSESRRRQLLEREIDSEYFRLIREKRFDEAEELLQRELKGGNQNE